MYVMFLKFIKINQRCFFGFILFLCIFFRVLYCQMMHVKSIFVFRFHFCNCIRAPLLIIYTGIIVAFNKSCIFKVEAFEASIVVPPFVESSSACDAKEAYFPSLENLFCFGSKMSTLQGTSLDQLLPELPELGELNIPTASTIQVTTYFNDRFPTDSALREDLSSFVAQLESAKQHLNSKITSAIHAHRHDTTETKNLANATNSSVVDLRVTLSSLTLAANAAQADLSAALEPAAAPNLALTNVTNTLNALQALTLLDTAVHKIETAAEKADLSTLAKDASTLSTVTEAMNTLEKLPLNAASRLRRLPSLRARATVARETLRATVLNAFKRHSDAVSLASDVPENTHETAIATLSAACKVAHSMGPDVRAEVIGAFVRRRRTTFSAAFSATDEDGLSTTERRLSWLRRELRTHWARLGGERTDRGWGRVFPEEWPVARRLSDGILAETREWIVSTLNAGADNDVAGMVSALKKVKEFEIELDRRFGLTDNNVQQKESFIGILSDCFTPFLQTLVKHEDEHLGSVVAELVREETWKCEDGTVLRSATELFLEIKKSMRTCASLDIRQTFFSVHRVFRKHMSAYASALTKRLSSARNAKPPPESNSTTNKPMDVLAYTLTIIAGIINTGEYCKTTTEQLEESMQKTVDKVYVDEIDFSKERDHFATVSAKGIQVIVLLVGDDIEQDLKTVSQRQWSTCAEVGDTSKYVGSIGRKLGAVAKQMNDQLSKQHFRFFLEKQAGAFMERLQSHLYKAEGVNNFGAQQLLLDISTLRSNIVGLPSSVHAATSATFVKFVNREMSRVEAVLKVILSPPESCVDTYIALMPGGSADDLQQVFQIKGLSRAEAAPLVLDYCRRMGPAQRLRPATRAAAASTNSQVALSNTSLEGSQALHRNDQEKADISDAQSGAVDSMRNIFGRWMDTGISDKLGQVSSQLESTTDRLKKEAVAARWSLFGK